jgi:hypothetical protein
MVKRKGVRRRKPLLHGKADGCLDEGAAEEKGRARGVNHRTIDCLRIRALCAEQRTGLYLVALA